MLSSRCHSARRLASVVCSVACLLFAMSPAAWGEVVAHIDLENNTHTCDGIEALQLMAPLGAKRAVLRLTLNRRTTEFCRALFEIHFTEVPEGFTVNIGDSATNNGFAGDGATQTRDSELQILEGGLFVYGDDTTPKAAAVEGHRLLQRVDDVVTAGTVLTVEVSNEYVSWNNGEGVVGCLDSPYLFALDGQPDGEGPVNYDIYAAFNRVICGTRTGVGVGRVVIRLYNEGEGPASSPASSWFGVPEVSPVGKGKQKR